ncbi:MAG TPA: glycosyltransferase family 4 protein, partial [Gemmatimonadaceae bacterium]|nr:glycosyltransferase family 4 protein [Gemmatimonadaceae bacterium]
SIGNSSIAIRLLGGFLFVGQVIARAAFRRRVDAIVVSTSPPVGALGGVVLSKIHRAPLKYWVMDVNPDQTVALGKLSADSAFVRVFDAINRIVLRRARDVIVLDHFMAQRINLKLNVCDKLAVIPPWPAEEPAEVISHDRNPFRRAHGLDGKVVVMYSGNHGPSNPLTTIIEAAKRITDDPRLVLMFVGGGIGKIEVDRAVSNTIRSLPYQPRQELRHSLAAADVHLVTVGDDIPGIVHPSKVYGAMAVARPILLLGPERNHVADILGRADIGWHVRHGDIDAAETALRSILAMGAATLSAKGQRAREMLDETGGRKGVCARLCDVLEAGL